MLRRWAHHTPTLPDDLSTTVGTASVSVPSTVPAPVVQWAKRSLALCRTLITFSDTSLTEALNTVSRPGVAVGVVRGLLKGKLMALAEHRAEYGALDDATPEEDEPVAGDGAVGAGAVVEVDHSVQGRWLRVGGTRGRWWGGGIEIQGASGKHTDVVAT